MPNITKKELRRLAKNDPKLDSISLRGAEDCRRVAGVLKGNTHVRRICVDIILFGEMGQSRNDEINSWSILSQSIRELILLEKLVIDIVDYEPTLDHCLVVGQLLRNSPQIKTLYLKSSGDSISDPTYSGILAGGIAQHPSLEEFWIEDFGERDALVLSVLLGALATVPNLKHVTLDCFNEDHDDDDDGRRMQMTDDSSFCLERLLRRSSLRSMELQHFVLRRIHVMAMMNALKSPDSQLEELTLFCCDIYAPKSLFVGVSENKSLQGITLSHVSFIDNRVDDITHLFEHLRSSTSLNNLNLTLDEDQSWPHFSFLQTNSSIERLEMIMNHSPISAESASSLFQALAVNDRVNEIYMENWVWDVNGNPDALAPLATNRGVRKLEILTASDFIPDDDEDDVEWPRFDFLRENRALRQLSISHTVPSQYRSAGFDSMCQALQTNDTLEILDLYGCNVEDAHVASLAHMIGDNAGLKKVRLDGKELTKEGVLTLLPALVRNTSLRSLSIYGNSELSHWVDEFTRRVLSDTSLRELVVGPWDGDDANAVIQIAAKNYHIEEVRFWGRQGSDAAKMLQGTLNAMTTLNTAGRRYLVDRSRGFECKAAGVNVLSKVINNLDCIFYHLRENPLLCNIGDNDREGATKKKHEWSSDSSMSPGPSSNVKKQRTT